MKEAMRKHPVAVAVAGVALGVTAVFIPLYSIVGMSVIRVIYGVVLLAVMGIMGAEESLKKVKQNFGISLRKAWYVIAFSFVLGALAGLLALSQFGFPESFLAQGLAYLVLCLSVGLYEEAIFRGVMLHGLLRKMGGTRRGVVRAVLITSFCFGLIHVLAYLFGGSYDLPGIAQALGKIISAGVMGFILAAIYVRYHNFWAIVVIHALNDFLPMLSLIFINGTVFTVGYVADGMMGNALVLGYLIRTLLLLPAIITAIRLLKAVEVPEYGIFR